MLHLYNEIIVFIVGAMVGSFLNVCIHRLPLEEEVVFTPSHCPHCNQAIHWWDNIPLLSWLALRGRCRHCKQGISLQYPLVELSAALLALHLYLRFGLTWEALALVVLGFAFIVLTVIDLFHYILPDVITKPGIAIGLLFATPAYFGLPLLGKPFPAPTDAWLGALIGGGGLWSFAWLFERFTGREGMGMGDVKLLALIGAWMGWQALPFTLFAASLLGSIVGVTWILIWGRDRHLPIPFGPYLTISSWVYIFVGPQVYHWYFNLFRPLA
ncbi:MAG: prepilin peptidase [Magnetococcales bacterium]|nr:prepilin peptidase [Magnetococcales bacterium]